MNSKQLECAIEAILFGAGESVSAGDLAEALETSADDIHRAVNVLADKYNIERRGLRIIRLEDSYQMCSREDYFDYIRRITEPRRKQALSPSALETLSVIAYHQPVTKSSVELIRGVDSTYSINKLSERGLIDEAGRLDAPGRPILYITTEEFLRCFGLKSLEDLPKPEGME